MKLIKGHTIIRCLSAILMWTALTGSPINASCLNLYCVYLPSLQKAPPIQVVRSIVAGVRSSGNLEIRGELINHTDQILSNIKLRARVYDTPNHQADILTGTAIVPVTLPSQLNFFRFTGSVLKLGDSIDHWIVEVITWTAVTTQTYVSLNVASSLPKKGLDQFSVEYSISNTINKPINDVYLWVWSIDEIEEGQLYNYWNFSSLQPNTSKTVVASYSNSTDYSFTRALAFGIPTSY